jgi:hypothetical protein
VRLIPISLNPDTSRKSSSCEHSRGLGRKHAQERELLRRQIDLSLAHSHIATCGIDPQLADLKRPVSSALLRAPPESVDPRRLLRVVERLAYLVV